MELTDSPQHSIRSVYVGGGSPSLLSAAEAEMLMQGIKKHFRLSKNAEISIEANPEDLSEEKLSAFIQAGFNRISIGAQSFHDADLQYLGRRHSARSALRSIDLAIKTGFSQISLDLIIGLPGQDRRRVNTSLEKAASTNISHLSLYMLEGVAGKKIRSMNQRETDLYHFSRQRLFELGFTQYEISNFHRSNDRCLHNLNYWKNGGYIAVGPSAARYLDDWDEQNTADLERYMKSLSQGKPPPSRRRKIPRPFRRIMTGLRLSEGLPESAFSDFQQATRFLHENGMLIKKRKRISVHPDKQLLLNEILHYFL